MIEKLDVCEPYSTRKYSWPDIAFEIRSIKLKINEIIDEVNKENAKA